MKTMAPLALGLATLAGAAGAETQIERGEYPVRGIMGCGNRHTPQGPNGPDLSRELGGFTVLDDAMMRAVAPNITPRARIAQWTDAELARAIHEGLRPDGSLIGPPTPYAMYRGQSDDDLAAIVAFLRTVPAVEGDSPPSEYRMPLPQAWGPPVETVAAPPRADRVAYGAYLAGPVAHCMERHTPMGPQGSMLDTALGAGGFAFVGPWGVSVAPNLTPHADGLAGYADDELRAMIVAGVRPDGTRMAPPMPYAHFAKTTPEDVDAIIAWPRTLPPLPDPS